MTKKGEGNSSYGQDQNNFDYIPAEQKEDPIRQKNLCKLEDTDTDTYIKKGYHKKTYQYYGVARSVDAAIYDQL